MISPLLSPATTTKVENSWEIAASTFNLIQSVVGGAQRFELPFTLNGFSLIIAKANSWILFSVFLVVAIILALTPLCRIWFLHQRWKSYIRTAWEFLLLSIHPLFWKLCHHFDDIFEFTGALSDFRPYLPANHIALAIGHLKNRWIHVFTALSHKGQRLSLDPNLKIRFSLVGSEFEPILQSSIFTPLGAFKLQIFLFYSICRFHGEYTFRVLNPN